MSRLLHRYTNWIDSLAAAGLILLWVYAAAVKLLAFGAFGVQLARQPFPPGLAAALRYALPLAELLAAALLLSAKSRRAGFGLSLVLLSLFTAYVALAWRHWWAHTPCSCGGVLGHLSWGPHLVFNLFFLALCVPGLFGYRQEKGAG